MNNEESIGQRIKTLRHNAGLSQVELAKQIGVSKQTLYKYENDIVTNIPSDKIEAIAYVLDTTPAYIMGWYFPNNIGKAIKELIKDDMQIGTLSQYLRVSEDTIRAILKEDYSFISTQILAGIADYFDVGISTLLKYNTNKIPPDLSKAMDLHDIGAIDKDAKFLNYLLSLGYEIWPDTISGENDYTLTITETGQQYEFSRQTFTLFKKIAKNSIDSVINSIINGDFDS